MTTSETTGQSPPSKSVQPQFTTNPYVGNLAVFLGAGLATLSSRLLSVGLPDLRGALGISFDDASWLPTAFNMTTIFSGVFVVFVNAFWGPRRILLPAAAIFTAASFLLPFAPNYQGMLALVIVAGLASGTFYSLTMTFVLTNLPKRLAIFGILSAWGGHPETHHPSQSSLEPQVSEHSEHHHPGHIHLRVQVPAPGRDCARTRLPQQHSTLPAAGDRTHACLGGPADVRGGVAGGHNHHLH